MVARMIIEPKIRGFVCITAHPTGCKVHVDEQIAYVCSQEPIQNGPKNVLVIGSSTGYGLASRISAAFGAGASTLGVQFERPSMKGKPASAGWYNTYAFEQAAQEAGLYAKTVNGDAFSNEIKAQVLDIIERDMGPIDLVVYSLASPRRTDPNTGEVYKSVLKPLGGLYKSRTLDTDKGEIVDVEIEPANAEEVEATKKVMGGEDWELWMDALNKRGLLADGVQTVAYSYIGPEITWPVYTNGTIGQAKEDLERAARELTERMADKHAKAYVSVNKALVTQASSAIPVVPLYISLLFKVMKEKGLHEGCIEQMQRMMVDHLYSANGPTLDEKGRIRVDDWEMREDVQSEVQALWDKVTTENLGELGDFEGYQADFLKLFGFGIDGVDYEADVQVECEIAAV